MLIKVLWKEAFSCLLVQESCLSLLQNFQTGTYAFLHIPLFSYELCNIIWVYNKFLLIDFGMQEIIIGENINFYKSDKL